MVVLCAVVLREHAELLHGVLRERIAAARIAADDAAEEHIVLVAHAVDEDIRLLGIEAVRADDLALGVRAHLDAGRHGREIEEVAVELRQRLDLLRRDVRSDLRRLRVDELIADHGDRLVQHRGRRQHQIQIEILAHADCHRLRFRFVCRRGDHQVVLAGCEAGQQIRAVCRRLHGVHEAAARAHRIDLGAAERAPSFVRHLPADRRGARLRERGKCEHAGEQRENDESKCSPHDSSPFLRPRCFRCGCALVFDVD